MEKKKVVTIGGGTGSYNLLRGLKKYTDKIEISAIVTMMDSGGSSGILRDEYGVLPPGDIRRCLIALSDETEILKKLFNYRFHSKKGNSLSGHNFGNLFLTALEKILNSEQKAIKFASKILKVRGKVLPVTFQSTHLYARLEDGTLIKGESVIDLPRSTSNLRIKRLYLKPPAEANPEVLIAIKQAQVIIIGPGDLFTSIIPNLVVNGVSKAIRKSKALKIYNCNIMTKYGETNDFSVYDHLATIEEYIGCPCIDVLTYNSKKLRSKILKRYQREKAKPVKFIQNEFKSRNIEIIGRNLVTEPNVARHDPEKIGKLIMKIISKRLS